MRRYSGLGNGDALPSDMFLGITSAHALGVGASVRTVESCVLMVSATNTADGCVVMVSATNTADGCVVMVSATNTADGCLDNISY